MAQFESNLRSTTRTEVAFGVAEVKRVPIPRLQDGQVVNRVPKKDLPFCICPQQFAAQSLLISHAACDDLQADVHVWKWFVSDRVDHFNGHRRRDTHKQVHVESSYGESETEQCESDPPQPTPRLSRAQTLRCSRHSFTKRASPERVKVTDGEDALAANFGMLWAKRADLLPQQTGPSCFFHRLTATV